MSVLDPHQVEAVSWLLSNPKGFLADKPGVGKTAPAIVAASMAANKLFVGCPAVGVTYWKRQVKEWWPELDQERDLMVVSHNMMAVSGKVISNAWTFEPDTIILDEAHRLRNPKSKTCQSYYGSKTDGADGLIQFADRIWPLSGTPKPNNSGEIYSHLRALRPDLITQNGKPLSYNQFIERYTDFSWTEYGPRFWRNKPATLPELKSILSKFMLRRAEGSIKLPPMVWEHVPVDAVAAKETLLALRELEASASSIALSHTIREAEECGGNLHWVAPDSHLAELRRVIGEIKAPTIARIIADELRDGAYNKIVLFAHHHSVIDALKAELLEFSPVVLTGKTAAGKKQEVVDLFQETPSVRVFIGQMDACGELITLTAADQVAFVEDSWVPDVVFQCAKRCHRRGQTKTVFARMFSLANSIDEGTIAVRTRKMKMDRELLGQ